jgi:hypothetical protein
LLPLRYYVWIDADPSMGCYKKTEKDTFIIERVARVFID